MTGLIIGKFCPPHRGHKLLIDTAVAESDEVTVLVCASESDPIPIDIRIGWLREIHPTVRFKIIFPDRFNRNDPNAWIAATLENVIEKPDFVFSSEGYGDLYAQLLGCAHRMIDRERSTVSCSATVILENPAGNLEFLEPCVQRYFIRHFGT